MLGRWMAAQSDDYVRTARQVVLQIQNRIAEAIRNLSTVPDEEDVYQELSGHLKRRGCTDVKVEAVIAGLKEPLALALASSKGACRERE